MGFVRGRRPHLVTLGDLTLDVIVHSQSGTEAGTDVPASVAFRAGGSAANTARAFARLGGASSFIGAVGADRVGRLAAQALRREGVRAHLVERRGHTARLMVLVSESGERSFLTDRGVADSVPWSSVRRAWFAGADALHLPAYSLLQEPLCVSALEAAR